VTDDAGKPIANVSVQVKGQNIGTTTNDQGQYSLSVPANARVIVFTSIGASPKEVSIGSGNTINASLASADQSMAEVVVVGYGTGRRVGTQVGSVATVDGATLQDRPAANAFDALQGKVAGLQVFTSSGEPSQLSSLRLHGVGSLGGSSTPLYVMDGIPIDPGTVISLNPNDFESVSVLKDASATSIYGSRAANGVIYITTKRGSANRPASITFQQQYGISNLANTEFFDRFMNAKQLADFFVASGYRTRAQMDATLAQYPNDTKWVDYFYDKDVPMYQADLSVTGGAGRTTYFISGGYLNQEGLAFRSGFKRYTLRSNLGTQVNDWLRLGLNLFMGSDKRQTNPYGSNNTNRGLGLLAPPWFTPIDPATGEQYYGAIPGWGNNSPKYLEDKIYSNSSNIQFNPSGFIQIQPIRNLTLKTQAGLEAFDFTTTSGTLPSYNNYAGSGASNELFQRGVTRTITNTGEYKFNLASDHNFTALVGQEFIDYNFKDIRTGSTGQTDDRLILVNQGTAGFTGQNTQTEYSYLSYFSRLEYNFRNRYFLDGSFRQDQSSRFGVDNRTANFWAVGAMWKAKQESFFNRINWLSDLTVKASYGTQGNSSIGNYESQATLSSSGNAYAGASGFAVSNPGNPELGWEKQSLLTVGFNFSLFNRARFNVELYDRVTENMLVSVPYPYTSGFSDITENVGSLRNSGIDFTFDVDVLKSTKAYITPYINLNYNKNEVTELFQGKEYWIIPNTGVLWAVGKPVSFSYPIFAQVNPQTGNPEWYLPATGKIMDTRKDPNAVTTSFSAATLEQNTGIKRQPPFNGGFGFTSGYDGLFLSADFSFSQGKYMINNDRYFFENPRVFTGYNQYNTVNDFWKQPGDVARFPRVGVTNWTQFDSRLIEDASFLRLKGVTLGYTLPQSILNKTGIVKASKVYITGRNLLTWTKYQGPDPEVDSNIGLGTNPNTKQIAFGLDLTF
jgi:TonB-linked SusC/RagA family outer membrane protein